MKKGMSLVEILIVMVIIIMVSGAGIISYNQVIKNSNKKKYETNIEEIQLAAEIYVEKTDNIKNAVITSGSDCLYLEVLMDANLIDENLMNPITNEPYGLKSTIRIDYNSTTGFSYTYPGTCD